ncbi:MAG: UPF0164 family protein [Treponema sp.]|jgi:tetratricopeptide (TPR) repeat protein|nr:UPF0164 family protein [Treponema sp.]
MMNASSHIRRILLFLITLAAVQTAAALDYTDVNATLSDIFDEFVDSNEGTTSFRSLNIPSGGRAESLGTAYTGLSDDVSFFDYNPAASSLLDYTEVAVFHNTWIADSALETLAATIRQGNLGAGVQVKCFYVPFTEYNGFGERVAGNYYSETSTTLNLSYNFLAGYNFKGIAVGLNAKGIWRSIPDYTDNDTDAIIRGSGLEQSGAGLMGDAGIMMRFNFAKRYASRDPNVRIGVSLLNAGAAFTGFGSSNGIQLDDPLPTKLAAGLSYKFIKPVTLSLEFRQPLDLRNISESGIWSAGSGIVVQMTDFFSLLGGFLLKGGNPRFSLGSEFEWHKITMNINYTLDLTSSINPINHISLSAKFNLGDRGRQKKQKQVDTIYNQGLAYYAGGDMEKAIATWNKALQIDKRFDPAIEGIKAAEYSLKLYDRVLDIQNLD